VGISYGLEVEMIANGIAGCAAVPGRFERVDEGQPFLVIVDYAQHAGCVAQCNRRRTILENRSASLRSLDSVATVTAPSVP